MRRLAIVSIAATVALAVHLVPAPTAQAAEAGTLTPADLAALGGTDFDGGPGDYFLRNDKIEATVLAVTATPDFGIPVLAEALPGRGVLVDLGTLGDKNDQLSEIDHVVNIAANVIFYGGPAEGLPAPIFVSGGATASITVSGIVLLPPSAVPPFPGSSPSFPTLFAQTTSTSSRAAAGSPSSPWRIAGTSRRCSTSAPPNRPSASGTICRFRATTAPPTARPTTMGARRGR
jgi:hypothetical protein